MNKPKLTEIKTHKSCPPVPRSIMTASRCELTDLSLFVVEGKIPNDLQGHAFFIAPVGSVDSGGLPYPDGNSILNGDGMIFRLDFDRQGTVRVTSRLAKPPCYYAEKATQPGTKYAKYGFYNCGISRFSIFLGLRNQLNTAFLPMKFEGESQERLLVTYDTGRPYEIDTETLEVITPVGANVEWQGASSLEFPFQSIFSTAHPVFDPHTSEVFTVNYGRSIQNLLETVPFVYEVSKLPKKVDELLKKLGLFSHKEHPTQKFPPSFNQVSQNVLEFSTNLLEKFLKVEIKDFVSLISWDGKGKLKRWKLILPDGSPVKIEQTIHQIGVTKDYVVLMDTAFKVGLDQVINNPFPQNKQLEQLLRKSIARPVSPDSIIYIVRRADLKEKELSCINKTEVQVVVKKLVIPLEAAHFLVNHENPDGQITLHVPHICAWDVSESLRTYDQSIYNLENNPPSYLHGMEQDEMDISRMGRYIIDGESGEIVDSDVIYDINTTWGPALYTYRDALPPRKAVQQIENIYWVSFGLWKDLVTQFIFDLYKDYKYRIVPPAELLRLAEKGIPACLFRLQTSNQSNISIADRYEFPIGHISLSPQFVPRSTDDESSTNGYIVCCVFTPECSEIWIFDAANLSKGPECKLRHPLLNFGLSIHTAWLPKIGRRTASYNIPVREDYDPIVKKKSREIQELFEQEVYPLFENPVNHS